MNNPQYNPGPSLGPLDAHVPDAIKASSWWDAECTLRRCARRLGLSHLPHMMYEFIPQFRSSTCTCLPGAADAARHCNTTQAVQSACKNRHKEETPELEVLEHATSLATRLTALPTPCHHPAPPPDPTSTGPALAANSQGRRCLAISAADEEISFCILAASCSLSLLGVRCFLKGFISLSCASQ